MFGKKVELQIEGRSSFKTYFGSFITLVYLGIVISASTPTFLEYLNTNQPGVIAESYKRSLYPEINLHKARHLPFMIAYSNEVDLIPFDKMSRYFTFSLEKIIWKEKEIDGVLGYAKEIIYTEPVPCGSLSEEEIASYDYVEKGSFLEELLMQYAICMPASSNLTVVGKGSDPEMVLISFKIKPCSLPNGIGCATEKELGKANFMWITPTSTRDSSNYVNPRSKYANADDTYYINPSIRQILSSKFKENVVFDLKGIFDPQPIERTRYFDIADIFVTNAFRRRDKITCEFAQMRQDDESCYSYFEFSFQSSGAIFNFKRSYKTLRDTLGEIGGLNELIILVILILVSPVVDWEYERFIHKKVFSFSQDKRIFPLLKHAGELSSNGGWCCKKVRNQSDEARVHSMIGKALDKKMDIINFIQDLNVLSLLSKIYLQQKHIKLAPLACLTDDLPDYSNSQETAEKIFTQNTSGLMNQINQSSNQRTSVKDKLPTQPPSNCKIAPQHSSILICSAPPEFDQILSFIKNKPKDQTAKPSKITRKIQKVPDEFIFRLFANRLPSSDPSPGLSVRRSPRRIKRIIFGQIDQNSQSLAEASRDERTDRL
jgi:hypothetical protein